MKEIRAYIVILILGACALWLGKTTTPSYDSKEIRTYLTISELTVGLVQFISDMDRYPTDEEGLASLLRNNEFEAWKGPYLKHTEVPTDEWGNQFVYINKGSFFRLFSSGKDGKPGTKDDLEVKTEHSHAPQPAARTR